MRYKNWTGYKKERFFKIVAVNKIVQVNKIVLVKKLYLLILSNAQPKTYALQNRKEFKILLTCAILLTHTFLYRLQRQEVVTKSKTIMITIIILNKKR